MSRFAYTGSLYGEEMEKSFLFLRHAPEIVAITNQWVNSYQRLVPGFEAPTELSWTKRNRSCAGGELVIDSRPTSGTPDYVLCSPYSSLRPD